MSFLQAGSGPASHFRLPDPASAFAFLVSDRSQARAALNIIVKERKDPKGFCSQRFSYIQQLGYIDGCNFLSPELQAGNLTWFSAKEANKQPIYLRAKAQWTPLQYFPLPKLTVTGTHTAVHTLNPDTAQTHPGMGDAGTLHTWLFSFYK